MKACCACPETARKRIEEIEEVYRAGGQKPWHIKPGPSALVAKIKIS